MSLVFIIGRSWICNFRVFIIMKRLRFIDNTRGLLLCMMILSHSVTLATNKYNIDVLSIYVPRGWATSSFIMLTGFSVAFLFDWRKFDGKLVSKLIEKAIKLFIVMYVSNAFMKVAKTVLDGGIEELNTLMWWEDLVVFNKGWTISGVLLPTAIFLAISPALFRLFAASKTHLIVASTAIICIIISYFSLWSKTLAGNYWWDIFMIHGAGGFPVAIFLVYGVIGFALGNLTKDFNNEKKYVFLVGVGVVSVLLLFQYADRYAQLSIFFIESVWRFLVLLGVGLVFSLYVPKYSNTLFAFGKNSLFIFIFHRIFMQIIYFSDIFSFMGYFGYFWCLFFLTIAFFKFMCIIREKNIKVHFLLKRAWI